MFGFVSCSPESCICEATKGWFYVLDLNFDPNVHNQCIYFVCQIWLYGLRIFLHSLCFLFSEVYTGKNGNRKWKKEKIKSCFSLFLYKIFKTFVSCFLKFILEKMATENEKKKKIKSCFHCSCTKSLKQETKWKQKMFSQTKRWVTCLLPLE